MTNPSLERLIAKWEAEAAFLEKRLRFNERLRELRVLIAAAKFECPGCGNTGEYTMPSPGYDPTNVWKCETCAPLRAALKEMSDAE